MLTRHDQNSRSIVIALRNPTSLLRCSGPSLCSRELPLRNQLAMECASSGFQQSAQQPSRELGPAFPPGLGADAVLSNSDGTILDRWRVQWTKLGSRDRDIGITTILVGALTGQHELSEADRQAVGDWMIDHAEDTEVRDLLTKIVRTQIGDTSEFREKVAEAIREKFRSEEGSPRQV